MQNTCKVLIVDDEPYNIEYLRQELVDYDYELLLASNGKQAIEVINSDEPDVILLDIMMPVMDGFDVLKELRSKGKLKDTAVVIISALTDISSIAKGIELGADDYLSKPFDKNLLLEKI